jgi:pyruvate dehydrogenase E2 component (dihydrolipoamide acetyltransferase)
MAPVYDGIEFQPRNILPLSLSYDHRAIDGAEAARFTAHIAQVLSDLKRLIL